MGSVGVRLGAVADGWGRLEGVVRSMGFEWSWDADGAL
jgi:hypothetical protein